ncbi:Chemosensory protein 1 [Gryllus bimaculatus]|nr:Chemosensory protein 1 [Gryllus bimaculatus]
MKFLLVLAAVAALAAAQSIEEIGNRDISTAIPEILNNNCGRCNPKQASNARLVVGFLQRNYPRVYTAVENKYRKGGRSG